MDSWEHTQTRPMFSFEVIFIFLSLESPFCMDWFCGLGCKHFVLSFSALTLLITVPESWVHFVLSSTSMSLVPLILSVFATVFHGSIGPYLVPFRLPSHVLRVMRHVLWW